MSDGQDIRAYKAGDRILTVGEPAQEAFLIVEGEVRVFLNNEGKIVDLAVLEAGQIFGEKALLEGGECSANVEAHTDAKLRIFDQKTLENILEKADPVLQALLPMLVQRLSATNNKLLKSETREFIDIDFL